VQNDSESTVSLLTTAVNMVDCVESEVDLRVTVSHDDCLNTSTDICQLNSETTAGRPSPAGCA